MLTTSNSGVCSATNLSEVFRAATFEAVYATNGLANGGSMSGSLSSPDAMWPDGDSSDGKRMAGGTIATADEVMTTRLTVLDFCAASNAQGRVDCRNDQLVVLALWWDVAMEWNRRG